MDAEDVEEDQRVVQNMTFRNVKGRDMRKGPSLAEVNIKYSVTTVATWIGVTCDATVESRELWSTSIWST